LESGGGSKPTKKKGGERPKTDFIGESKTNKNPTGI